MNAELKLPDLGGMSAPELAATANRVLPRWVALALAVAIGWKLAGLLWLLVPGGTGGEPIAPPPAASAAGPGAAADSADVAPDVASIVSAHLFGVASAEAPPAETDPIDAPETRLSLKLKGTLAARDPKAGIAIIADAAGDEKVYAVEDSIPGGVKLHAVHVDRVILNRSGALEALKLPREFEAAGTRRSRLSTTRASGVARPPAGSVREVLSRNVSRLTDVIRPQPYFSQGRQRGYRVFPGKNRRQFAALGLRPGDLVTEINGTPLTDPQQGMAVFQSLGDADQVQVTVERNGESQVLTLSTGQLDAQSGNPTNSNGRATR